MMKYDKIAREAYGCENYAAMKKLLAKCYKCKYACRLAQNENFVCCAYLLITGERRGCPPHEACTKFEEGRPSRGEPSLCRHRPR